MKVLLQGRLRLMEVGGGDKVQILNTAAELKKLGVDVSLSFELNTDYSQFDIIHVFQMDWTPETYLYIKKAKKLGKPLILSPIHHSLADVKKFDDHYKFGLRRISGVLFSDQHTRDTLKNINRAIFDPLKRFPTLLSVFVGLKNMHKYALSSADYVLVQTDYEAQVLKDSYNTDFKWKTVPNGVGTHFLSIPPESEFFNSVKKQYALKDNYILCVGRIEPRKNQLNVIHAVKELRNQQDLELVFIGKESVKNHLEYVLRFRREVKKHGWVKHIGVIPYEEMPQFFKHAKVCVSASWFESTGLTSLEALFCGTNAVATGTAARECLGDLVSYCKPDNVDSIKSAVRKEYLAPRPEVPPSFMSIYTWESAAKETLKAYEEIL